MTAVDDILAAVRQAGADLRVGGGGVQVLHGDRLPAELRDRLRANRAAVLAALVDAQPVLAPTIAWCSPEPQHRRVVEALAERDRKRLTVWLARQPRGKYATPGRKTQNPFDTVENP